MAERKAGSLGVFGVLLVLAAFALGIAFFGLSGLTPGSRDAAENAGPGAGAADLRIAGVRWRVYDRNHDGQADYVFRPGLGTAFGFGTYEAGRGSFLSRALDGELQETASAVLRLKTDLCLTAGAPLDVDDDGRADCIASVYRDDALLARRADAPCPGRLVARPLSPDWERVTEEMALERKFASLLAR